MTDTGRKNQDFKEKISTGEPMRLNKFLSDAGVCSRRQADRYVEQGRILIDGEPAQLGPVSYTHLTLPTTRNV